MKRRDFLKTAAAAAASLAGALRADVPDASAAPSTSSETEPLARRLPRWRGFNLLEKFQVASQRPFAESDFDWMTEWGFDFVRLPMDYRCWTDRDAPDRLDAAVLKQIDQAVQWGEKYGVHVSLNLHRAPGYTVAHPPERLNLWKDEEAQKQFDFQWAHFAKRYQGVPSKRLSFDLVNEPANVDAASYARVCRRVVAAIRREDAERLVICDGLDWARTPVFELVDLAVAQSTRGYDPMALSHYGAAWMWNKGRWAKPTWPLVQDKKTIDREALRRERIEPWQKLAKQGVGVHVGEWGAFNKTPHDVALAWMRDFLGLWKEAGWGWALWNFRGGFGILDSHREDVRYKTFHDHQLDRAMLDLLREF
ncbi:MAG: cellulase family glycosylhydrolase [Pirellulales bacterium]|nr:cellulase family glycosylhydrolase [Pirellulales bacterium]